ncbi:hypothetical protein ACFCX0_28845 [Streptomyces sp. NPDC056352]
MAGNRALLWHLLRTLDVPARPAGYGALLSGRYDRPGRFGPTAR